MRNVKNLDGSALVGLIIVLAIAMLMVFGYRFFGSNGEKQNQIQTGQEAIDDAQEAADAQNDRSMYFQNEIADPPPVNFHGVVDQARDLPK